MILSEPLSSERSVSLSVIKVFTICKFQASSSLLSSEILADSKGFSDLYFFKRETQRFFTLFSVLPGNFFAISDHFFPFTKNSLSKITSSLFVHEPFFRDGSRWFVHLSLHCLLCLNWLLPDLEWSSRAISRQWFAPFWLTISSSISSSLLDQGILFNGTFKIFCHRSFNCSLFLPGYIVESCCQAESVYAIGT